VTGYGGDDRNHKWGTGRANLGNSASESGDIEEIPNIADADSESVDKLIEDDGNCGRNHG